MKKHFEHCILEKAKYYIITYYKNNCIKFCNNNCKMEFIIKKMRKEL